MKECEDYAIVNNEIRDTCKTISSENEDLNQQLEHVEKELMNSINSIHELGIEKGNIEKEFQAFKYSNNQVKFLY